MRQKNYYHPLLVILSSPLFLCYPFPLEAKEHFSTPATSLTLSYMCKVIQDSKSRSRKLEKRVHCPVVNIIKVVLKTSEITTLQHWECLEPKTIVLMKLICLKMYFIFIFQKETGLKVIFMSKKATSILLIHCKVLCMVKDLSF